MIPRAPLLLVLESGDAQAYTEGVNMRKVLPPREALSPAESLPLAQVGSIVELVIDANTTFS